jgi:hypothetical protein
MAKNDRQQRNRTLQNGIHQVNGKSSSTKVGKKKVPHLGRGERTAFVNIGIDTKGTTFARMMLDNWSVPFRFIEENFVYLGNIVRGWDLQQLRYFDKKTGVGGYTCESLQHCRQCTIL